MFPSVQDHAGKLFSTKVTWHRAKDEVTEERRRSLVAYLNYLTNDKAISQSPIVRFY
jgi:hypothetical protein